MYDLLQALQLAENWLKQHSDSTHLDAEILLLHTLNITRTYLYAHSEQTLNEVQFKQYQHFINRRKVGEPIAYITGHKEFWSLEFIVTKSVLIPRPETELLVELSLSLFPKDQVIKIADLGLGSGAVAIALANERQNWELYGTENSSAALDIAFLNAKKFKLKNVSFLQSQWCLGLPKNSFNAIVSNPPYIAYSDPHLKSLKFEPTEALIAGSDGLTELRKIIPEAKEYLMPGGFLLLEHGYTQAEPVSELFKNNGYHEIHTVPDLAGNPRVTMGKIT